jgi:hypothetical protein
MHSTTHLATIEDDGRHVPGPQSMPLWNESYWFPFYDPKTEVGVIVRAGILPNRQESNLFFFITHRGAVVHSFIDQQAPVPPVDQRRLVLDGFTMEWEKPREQFRLRYVEGAHAVDVVWTAYSPVYKWPLPPGVSYDQMTGHIEQGGRVTGTVTIKGTPYRVDCLSHRDHSWGGERDWSKLHNWDYLSGEIDQNFWFNAVRIAFGPGFPDITIGCLWDGKELHEARDIKIQAKLQDGGTRQVGVDARFTDENGREYHLIGEQVLVNCLVPYGRTWLKDAITRYRLGDRVGYGIHEIGYQEQP